VNETKEKTNVTYFIDYCKFFSFDLILKAPIFRSFLFFSREKYFSPAEEKEAGENWYLLITSRTN
jgi:hypothetical protein